MEDEEKPRRVGGIEEIKLKTLIPTIESELEQRKK